MFVRVDSPKLSLRRRQDCRLPSDSVFHGLCRESTSGNLERDFFRPHRVGERRGTSLLHECTPGGLRMLRSVLQSGCAPPHQRPLGVRVGGQRLPFGSPFHRRLGLAVPVAVRPFHAKHLVPRALRRAAGPGLSLSGGAFVAHRGPHLLATRVVRYPRHLLCAAACQTHSPSSRFFLAPFVPHLLSLSCPLSATG